MSVEELTLKAQEELRKLRVTMNKDQEQDTAKMVLEQSVMFADNVIKRLVAHTLGKEVDDLFDTIVKSRGEVLIEDSSNESKESTESKKYTLGLDIVDHDYMLNLQQFKGNEQVKERMVFLLNTVKVLYCPIKDHMKKWAGENDTTFNYVLQIGLNTTLFLDKDSKKRIGIILKKVK